MIREIIKIDEEKCDGCGLCIPGCPEGALQIIDGKARLVSDLMCDGLGACLGECPLEAITIEKREAEKYNETEVIKVISKQGKNTTIAHLKHLQEHGETDFFNEAMTYLNVNRGQLNFNLNETITEMKKQTFSSGNTLANDTESKTNQNQHPVHNGCGCPGAATMDFRETTRENVSGTEEHSCHRQVSELKQWPIQMHLVNPMAPYFRNADLILAADCVAFAMGDFHNTYLKGRSIAIACPKLDSHQEVYVSKLVSMIDGANLNTIAVMIMEVPCCGSLLQMTTTAVQEAKRKVPVKMIKVGLQGEIQAESWV